MAATGTIGPGDLRQLAVEVAREAGAVLDGHARRLREGADLGVGMKTSPTDLVSDADRASERAIATAILDHRPDDAILGEEGEATRAGGSGLRWVVDPLDGTINFLRGLDAWCVSIAVEDATGPLAGVVHQPTTGDTFAAARGHGATLAGRELHVSTVDEFSQMLVATGFAYAADVRADQGRDVARLLPAVRDIRRAGSAALDLAWCSAGRVDAYFEFALAPWDWAAGRLLVTEAGGTVTEHERQLGTGRQPGLVAGGAAAHARLTDWLDDVGEGSRA